MEGEGEFASDIGELAGCPATQLPGGQLIISCRACEHILWWCRYPFGQYVSRLHACKLQGCGSVATDGLHMALTFNQLLGGVSSAHCNLGLGQAGAVC